MYIQKNRRRGRIVAEDEIMDVPMPEEMDMGGGVDVAPEATDLLFEAEDVAELVAEITEMPVEVEVADEGDSVTFSVGEDVYTVEAEGDEEVLEARRIRGKRPVRASRPATRRPARRPVRRPVKSSTATRRPARRPAARRRVSR